VPPGYMDAKKPEPRCFGDALVWHEIIDRAKISQVPMIVVTDDAKEDWWKVIDGRKFGPRHELRQELIREAGVELLLYQTDRFLQQMGSQLQIKVSSSSVDDARATATEEHKISRHMAELISQRVLHSTAGPSGPHSLQSHLDIDRTPFSTNDRLERVLFGFVKSRNPRQLSRRVGEDQYITGDDYLFTKICRSEGLPGDETLAIHLIRIEAYQAKSMAQEWGVARARLVVVYQFPLATVIHSKEQQNLVHAVAHEIGIEIILVAVLNDSIFPFLIVDDS